MWLILDCRPNKPEKPISLSVFRDFQIVQSTFVINNTDIELVKEGDHAAFKLVYQKSIAYVYSIVNRYVNKESDQPDVVQEIYARVFLSIDSFDPNKGEFKYWLRRIVVNQCIKHYRKRKKSDNLVVPLDAAAYELEAEDTKILSRLSRADIEYLLSKMPEGYRQVFMLVVLDEYPHKEVGELLEISEETSRSQLSRAKKWIRNKLSTNKQKILTGEI